VSDVVVSDDGVIRCFGSDGDPMRSYHDLEWGRPVADDRRLFEKLSLEGFQAGLSWNTILRKRENFRLAFKSFDFDAVARFNERDVARLMGDAGIVRNRAKIEATVNNARRCLDLVDEAGSLAAYVWRFEPDAANRPSPASWQMVQSTNPEATAMSKDLKRRGWAFVGPTTVYAFMQAMGLVNDHLSSCFAREEVEQTRRTFRRPG
jgi:DNA-3-methyladenine glycosylase I